MILTLLGVCLFFMQAVAAAEANPTVRVGLYYNTTSLVTANLQNKVGYGYRLGFFDSQENFINIWSIDDTNKITMGKDQNLYCMCFR